MVLSGAIVLMYIGPPIAHAAGGKWIKDQHNCTLWESDPTRGESVTWSGACVGDYAIGRGIERWTKASGAWEESDRVTLRRGKSFRAILLYDPRGGLEYYRTWSDRDVSTYTEQDSAGSWVACAFDDLQINVCSPFLEVLFTDGQYGAGATGQHHRCCVRQSNDRWNRRHEAFVVGA